MNTLECIPGKEFLQCEENSAIYHYSEIIDEVESVSPGFMQQVKPDDIFIHAMEVKITTFCSLHCRDCTHLIPYVNTQRFASVDKTLADLEIFEKPVVTDYLDVRGSDIGELPEKLRSYINDTQYMQGCYYCGGFHTCSPSVPPAVQLKRHA